MGVIIFKIKVTFSKKCINTDKNKKQRLTASSSFIKTGALKENGNISNVRLVSAPADA